MNNQVKCKSRDFAIRIINLYKFLQEEFSEFVISKQILRSGTSIGANIAESQGAQSDADFIAKLHIALKEAKETEYWIDLLRHTNFLTPNMEASITKDLNEIISLLIVILKTKKANMAANAKK